MSMFHTDRTHRLGARAYVLFLGRGLLWLVLAAGALFAWWWYAAQYIPKGYVIFYEYSIRLFSLFLAAYCVFLLMRALLMYRAHGYRFDDEFFHITRGYLTQDDVGVVYHQIQSVTISRSIGARLVGVARLVIDTSNNGAGSQIHLPGIDARKAKLVQREILARARKSQHGAKKQGAYQAVPFDELDEDEG